MRSTPCRHGRASAICSPTSALRELHISHHRRILRRALATLPMRVGLGAAIDYVSEIGMENIAAYEHDLLNYGTAKLLTVPGLRLIGTAREKAGVMSFVLDDVRTEDVGVALN